MKTDQIGKLQEPQSESKANSIELAGIINHPKKEVLFLEAGNTSSNNNIIDQAELDLDDKACSIKAVSEKKFNVRSIKSGEFVFNQNCTNIDPWDERQEPKTSPLENHESIKHDSQSLKHDNLSLRATLLNQSGKKEQTAFKVARSMSRKAEGKTPVVEINKKKKWDYVRSYLSRKIASNRYIHLIFNHFCKNNQLQFMKSSLFEDRPKLMEEMVLNKWMVFVKEFELIPLFASVSINSIKQLTPILSVITECQLTHHADTASKRQKEINSKFIQIFKKQATNGTHMSFPNFTQALELIFQELKAFHSEDGANRFIQEILFCKNQKQCFSKLTKLKIQFAAPQITYEKVFFDNSNMMSRLKDLKHSKLKQKVNSSSPQTYGLLNSRSQKYNLNKVIQQAKTSVKESKENKFRNQEKINKCSSLITLPKISQSKTTNYQLQTQVLEYFQNSQDEILDKYFLKEKVNQPKKESLLKKRREKG